MTSLPVVDVRIQTTRFGGPASGDGRDHTVPAQAKLLPDIPQRRTVGPGIRTLLGVSHETAADIDVGELIAVPDHNGNPTAKFKVIGKPEPVEGAESAWLEVKEPMDTGAQAQADENAQYWEMRRARERAEGERAQRRAEAEAEALEMLREAGFSSLAEAIERGADQYLPNAYLTYAGSIGDALREDGARASEEETGEPAEATAA